jgi:hypothetical protein
MTRPARTSGAVRAKVWYDRKKRKVRLIELEVPEWFVRALVSDGLLPEVLARDRRAIGAIVQKYYRLVPKKIV